MQMERGGTERTPHRLHFDPISLSSLRNRSYEMSLKGLTSICCVSLSSSFQNSERAGPSCPSQALGCPDSQILNGNLPFSGLTPQLFPDFNKLPCACRSDGMSFAFKSPRGVDGLRPVQSCQAFLHCFVSFARLEETQVLDVQDLSYREAIMYLGNLNIFVLEPRQAICLLCCISCRLKIGKVILGMSAF